MTSPCSPGGLWVLDDDGTRGTPPVTTTMAPAPPRLRASARGVVDAWQRDAANLTPHRTTQAPQTLPRETRRHHPPPASRATARGVVRGWTDDETHDSTLDHRHEPLLVGWKGVLVRYGCMRREKWDGSKVGRGFLNFLIFCPLL